MEVVPRDKVHEPEGNRDAVAGWPRRNKLFKPVGEVALAAARAGSSCGGREALLAAAAALAGETATTANRSVAATGEQLFRSDASENTVGI